MEAGCSCPCPRHESGGSRSVGSICSATRCGAVIRQAEGDQAQWHLGNSFSPLLQTNFSGMESDNFLISIHLILDFHHLMSGCSLIVVLSSMSVGHCLLTLIANYGSGVFFTAEPSLIACIPFLYAVLIYVGLKDVLELKSSSLVLIHQ